jgi:hypothetical protein
MGIHKNEYMKPLRGFGREFKHFSIDIYSLTGKRTALFLT